MEFIARSQTFTGRLSKNVDPDPRVPASDPHPQLLASASDPEFAKSVSFLSASANLLRISANNPWICRALHIIYEARSDTSVRLCSSSCHLLWRGNTLAPSMRCSWNCISLEHRALEQMFCSSYEIKCTHYLREIIVSNIVKSFFFFFLQLKKEWMMREENRNYAEMLSVLRLPDGWRQRILSS